MGSRPRPGYRQYVTQLLLPSGAPRPDSDSGSAVRVHTRRFTIAIVSALGAVVDMTLSSTLGAVHGHQLDERLFAFIGAAIFFVLGVVSVHSASGTLTSLVAVRAGRSGATAIRVVVSFVGYTIVVFVGLGLLSVPVQHLLVGGALTGVIVGIAAQQALGNVFAGLVLLLARPFNLDQRVRVRSGALGGNFEGVIRGMNLVYVSIESDAGMVNVPNSIMLSVGVGPVPQSGPDAELAVVTTGAPPTAEGPSTAASPWDRTYGRYAAHRRRRRR
jgi:small-conductance mechanosensitive channel